MSSVKDIISYKRSPDEDFYKMLNCDENSSIEQIQAEYKVLALENHPDKNDGDKEKEAKFQKLKMAKETLVDAAKRANYDKWRNSGINISYQNWLGMKEHVHQSMHWATPKTKDRMLPETAGAASVTGSSLSAGQPNPAHRRASEGGAALYYGSRKSEMGGDNSDIANKFRNYEI